MNVDARDTYPAVVNEIHDELTPSAAGPSLLGIENCVTFGQKLWLTVRVLLVAGFIWLMMLLIANTVQPERWLTLVGRVLAELFGTFLALVVVFIWCRPRWLTGAYRLAEKKIVAVTYVFAYAIVVAFVAILALLAVIALFRL